MGARPRAAVKAHRARGSQNVFKGVKHKSILIHGSPPGAVAAICAASSCGAYALRLSEHPPDKDLAKGEESSVKHARTSATCWRVTKGVDASCTSAASQSNAPGR